MSRISFLTIALATALFAGQASAAAIVIGSSRASACYQAAAHEWASQPAIDGCTRALEDSLNNKDRASTLVNRGILHLIRQDTDLALADFESAIRLEPTLAEGYTHRGLALMQRNDYRAAVASITQGIQLSPNEPQKAYFNRAVANEELRDLRAAYDDYRQAAALAPNWDMPRTELTRFQVRR